MSMSSSRISLQAVLIASLFAGAAQAAPSAETVPGLEQAASQALDRVAPQVRAAKQGFADAHADEANVIDVSKINKDKNWVLGTVTRKIEDGKDDVPVSRLFVAFWTGQSWEIALEGEQLFGILTNAAPADVVSAEEKAMFKNQSAVAAQMANQAQNVMADTGGTQTGLSLPWAEGVSWYMGGGPHGNSGSSRPFDSIDFSGGNGQVLAPRDGRIYKSCINSGSAIVQLVHDNGYTTRYYHMINLPNIADGTLVRKGTYLGTIGNALPCGGSSTGAHVHFSLSMNGQAVPVHGKVIGGWQFTEGSQPYAGYASRGSTRVYPGYAVYNYGGGSTTTPTPTPTPTPSPSTKPGIVRSNSSNMLVNLRSAPSLNASILGTVRDGTTVQISCYKLGDWVTGMWQQTNIWNRLSNGQWISDGFVDTGSNNPVVPMCK
ncbi:peptidoglycan DD-metalloendopeptidase family protein [Chitinimonas lacunae]|uniref:Peptidoglycan DD-metalloendopeptidase family protein n=1 Tax=Chitinimonas lacunae TaxID=1963018 RepID=A0ABV8MMI1_9NEIS